MKCSRQEAALQVVRNIAEGLMHHADVHEEVAAALHEAANTLEMKDDENTEDVQDSTVLLVDQEVSELSQRCCPLCKGRGYTDGD